MAQKKCRPVPPGKKRIFVKSYRNKWTGKLMIAANYGLDAFPIDVPDDDGESGAQE